MTNDTFCFCDGHQTPCVQLSTLGWMCPKCGKFPEDSLRVELGPRLDMLIKLQAMAQVDNNYCGLEPITTGKHDPYWPRCRAHDVLFEQLKAGHPTKTNLQVQAEFAKGVLKTGLAGLYAFATMPVYLLVGCVGGMFRWTQLQYRQDAKRGIKPPRQSAGE